MELRSQAKVPDTTPGHVRGTDTVGDKSFGWYHHYTRKFAFVTHWNHQGQVGNFPPPPRRGWSVQGRLPTTP